MATANILFMEDFHTIVFYCDSFGIDSSIKWSNTLIWFWPTACIFRIVVKESFNCVPSNSLSCLHLRDCIDLGYIWSGEGVLHTARLPMLQSKPLLPVYELMLITIHFGTTIINTYVFLSWSRAEWLEQDMCCPLHWQLQKIKI